MSAGQDARRGTTPRLGICGAENQLLASICKADRAQIDASAETVSLKRGYVLVEPGEQVHTAIFPSVGCVVSVGARLEDGRNVEAATVGCEGVIGGVVSCGTRPAFASAVVQIAGQGTRVSVRVLEDLKGSSPAFRRLFDRYADYLFAQSLQSVACTAFHSLDQRLCRWLLTTQDRVGLERLPLTQEMLADMIGVQRTTVSTVSRAMRERGLFRFSHGQIEILDRAALEAASCSCYHDLEEFRRATTANVIGSRGAAA